MVLKKKKGLELNMSGSETRLERKKSAIVDRKTDKAGAFGKQSKIMKIKIETKSKAQQKGKMKTESKKKKKKKNRKAAS